LGLLLAEAKLAILFFQALSTLLLSIPEDGPILEGYKNDKVFDVADLAISSFFEDESLPDDSPLKLRVLPSKRDERRRLTFTSIATFLSILAIFLFDNFTGAGALYDLRTLLKFAARLFCLRARWRSMAPSFRVIFLLLAIPT